MADQPQDPPNPDPPPEPPKPEPTEPTELEKLIDSMAKFDPGDIERRLTELGEKIGNTDVAGQINDALSGPIGELTKAVKSLTKLVQGGASSPPPASAEPATDPPPPATTSSPSPANGGGGILGALFDVPEVK